MKIIVTGGAGFIGSHLCQRLLEQGHEVLCIDNLMTGSMNNLTAIINNPKFTFLNHNIRNQFNIDFVPDQIYDLACPASPLHYQNASLETLLTCLQGSINVLNFAQKTKARVLLTSTSQVYGDPEISPQPQTYWGHVNTVGIRSCYDEGKRASQTLFIQYNRVKNVDIRIARIFNTYGPRLDQLDGRVVSNFICQAIRNDPITVYGDGSQTRSFCYIQDQVDGLVKLMNSESYVGPINIGNPIQMTVKYLSGLIIELTGSKSEITFCQLPSDDPKQRRPQISKAKKYLDWEPKVGIEQGLKKTIVYFRDLYQKELQAKQQSATKSPIKTEGSIGSNEQVSAN